MEKLPKLDDECFFIAPIGDDGSDVRKRSDGVLHYIVAEAAKSLGLRAVRADEIAEPGQINLQVINHVLGARAAVVDLTGLNPNVFYELAVRHTARLPVALIAEKGCHLPFDIAQMRTIFFDHTDLASAANCRAEIEKHLGEALAGAVDSPIATAVDVASLQAGSVVERNVAELVTSVERVARSQRQLSYMVREIIDAGEGPQVNPQAIKDLIGGLDSLEALVRQSEDGDLVAALEAVRKPTQYLRSHSRVLNRHESSRRDYLRRGSGTAAELVAEGSAVQLEDEQDLS